MPGHRERRVGASDIIHEGQAPLAGAGGVRLQVQENSSELCWLSREPPLGHATPAARFQHVPRLNPPNYGGSSLSPSHSCFCRDRAEITRQVWASIERASPHQLVAEKNGFSPTYLLTCRSQLRAGFKFYNGYREMAANSFKFRFVYDAGGPAFGSPQVWEESACHRHAKEHFPRIFQQWKPLSTPFPKGKILHPHTATSV